MSQRKVQFNVNELARCAAEAVGAKSCVNIEKYPDGMYNKAMLLTMENGSQVVAKVPNPNAGLPHFTTASEVATMDFVKNVLKTPVPRVLAWSSKAQENTIGAEYIIMEKVSGIELERVWPSMDIKDRLKVVKSIALMQKAWTSISFHQYGSLYFTEDLDEPTGTEPLYFDAYGKGITDKRYQVGPSIGRESIDNGRATINFDRGPCKISSPITLCGPGTYIPTKEKKLRALHCYLKLIKFLFPTDQAISSAHLWHGLIDWQSTEISPLYFQARQPQIIDHDGPPVHGLERPQLPKNIEKLEANTKQHAETLYLQQSLCALYNTLTHHQNPQLYAALEFQQTTSYLLLLLARNLLIDGEATYLSQVAELEATWDSLPEAKGSIYPFTFSAKEREDFQTDVEGAGRGMDAMRSLKESIGELFPEQGIVRPDQYEEALDALAQMKDQVIEEFATTEQERGLAEDVAFWNLKSMTLEMAKIW
ncbi:hypothetical protein P153DRAFT_424425 [Dothidotthia symphoricarpi CBS 119687]|uniref:Altered inheritance of mitochondria protein 9, mitochondrial n=1 Tax=Dothidotthia symphoricarpi CBS 119687 TaxID=1392245 RepID=A0A6A6A7Q0_9PLEO|nr:uncharacterized protein P153DRAFT_424425 [Dothidotthia symphoricarpi CBS 119687]KAF2127104.1 hypothetical protein P153DRAFT_424425 [Dothidotthia symphoricarpi CBS 119687]